jgi:hypothetical protein
MLHHGYRATLSNALMLIKFILWDDAQQRCVPLLGVARYRHPIFLSAT